MGATGSSEWPAADDHLLTCATSNDTQIAACFGRGTCEFAAALNYSICVCPSYDPLSFCARTVYEFFPAHGAWLYGAVIAVSLLLALLFGVDLALDLRHNARKIVRTPPFVAKSLICAYGVLHALIVGVKLREGIVLAVATGAWRKAYAYLTFFAGPGLLVGIAYQVVCIAWLDMLLRAKNLGVSRRATRRLRLATIWIAATTYVAAIVCSVIAIENVAGLAASVGMFANIAGVVGQLFSITAVTVMLVKVLMWLRWSHIGPSTGRIRRIKQKGLFLAGINGVTLAITVYSVARLSSATVALSPTIYTTSVVLESLGALTVALFFFFLENSFLRGLASLDGKVRSGSSADTPPSNTTSTTPDVTSVSDALA